MSVAFPAKHFDVYVLRNWYLAAVFPKNVRTSYEASIAMCGAKGQVTLLNVQELQLSVKANK